jgi:hypothetical protein
MTSKSLEKLSALIVEYRNAVTAEVFGGSADHLDAMADWRNALVAFVDDYGAQQRREGRREGRNAAARLLPEITKGREAGGAR